jgi:hypothetical protein
MLWLLLLLFSCMYLGGIMNPCVAHAAAIVWHFMPIMPVCWRLNCHVRAMLEQITLCYGIQAGAW